MRLSSEETLGAPEIPEFEEQRLEALYKLEVLDTAPEEGFDRLVRMAISHFNLPIAGIAIVDMERIWFKSIEGLNLKEVPREGSICARTILGDDILLISDVLEDPEYKANPPVFDGKEIRFYAGVPIAVDGGFNIGCLHIMDLSPREFHSEDYEMLKNLAALVGQQFAQRRFEQDSRFLVSQTMRLNTVLEAVADGILTIDEEGQIESLNSAAANIFGYDRYELEGRSFHHLMPDLGRGGWKGYLKLRAENKHRAADGSSVELKGCRKDGLLFPMDLRVREMFVDGKRLYTGIIRDITQDKANRDEITRAREILEATKENVPLGITVFDEQGLLTIVNSRFANFLDLSPKYSEIGTSVRDIIEFIVARGDFGELNDEKRGELVESLIQQPRKQQYITTKPAGRYIEISSRPMPGGGLVSIYSDLTTRLRNEERLEAALQEANRANEAKTNFLSTISHEIRTPLNGVIGVSQMLADSHLNPEQREQVDAILRSGKTLLELINDVLDMNKIESGNIDLEHILFNLHDVIHTIKSPFMLQAREKGVSFNILLDEDVPEHIKSDPVRVRQILTNLLGNALKFTERGSVDLFVSAGDKTESGRQSVLFKVVDTGVGIPKDRQEQVFESFSQADTSIGRQYGGTGLGLSIVKKLVEMLGGTISLDSEIGSGSTFEISMLFALPEKDELNDFLSMQENVDEELQTGLKILVAEDNDVNAMVTEAFLKKMKCQSVVAEDGLKALDRFAKENFDLILMDVHMPEMDGVEATRRIRDRQDGKHIPIIGLTAEAFNDRHAIFKDAGMNEVLTKPFTEAALLKVISEYAPEKSVLNSEKSSSKTATSENRDIDVSSEEVFKSKEQNILSPASNLVVGSDVKLQEYIDQLGADVTVSLISKTPDTIEKELGVLKAAIDAEDQALIYRSAHTIAGVAGSMCADRLALQASIIEKNSEDMETVQSVFPEFFETADVTISWWKDVIHQLQV